MLNVCFSLAQKSPTNCVVLLKPVQIEVSVFNKPNGEEIYKIMNDTLTENYYTLQIIEKKGNWFKIKPNSISENKMNEGWIQIDSTGIYSRNYESPLVLFEKPNTKSKRTAEIQEYFTEMLQVMDCEDSWILVSIKLKDKSYCGWLSPKDQCANQYTTCN